MKIPRFTAAFALFSSFLAQAHTPSVHEAAGELSRLTAHLNPKVEIDDNGTTSVNVHSSLPLPENESFCVFRWQYAKDGSELIIDLGTTAQISPAHLSMPFEHPKFKGYTVTETSFDSWISYSEPGPFFVPVTLEKGRLRVERQGTRTLVRLERQLTLPKTPIFETDGIDEGAVNCVFHAPLPTLP